MLYAFAFYLAHLGEPEPIKNLGVGIVFLNKRETHIGDGQPERLDTNRIMMDTTMWNANGKACRDRYPVRKRKVFHNFASYADFNIKVRKLENTRGETPSIHIPGDNLCDSFTKLSNFLNFPMADLLQPSSFITASTSSRMGCKYSGRVAKLINTFVNA